MKKHKQAIILAALASASTLSLATITAQNKDANAAQDNSISLADTTKFESIQAVHLDEFVESITCQAGQQVTVAVIDSGLAKNHEVFANRINATQFPIYTLEGQDNTPTLSYDSKLIDTSGHGTFVSSIIAKGTPSCVKILPIVSNSGSQTATVAALDDFYDKKLSADFINLSWGIDIKSVIIDECGNTPAEPLIDAEEHWNIYNENMAKYNSCKDSLMDEWEQLKAKNSTHLSQKLAELKESGTLLIQASGNSNNFTNSPNLPSYPDSLSYIDSVISVGATNRDNTSILPLSNYDKDQLIIDFVAPGEDIHMAGCSVSGPDCDLDILNNSTDIYSSSTGTSFSAPVVTAAMASLKVKYPNYSMDQIIRALQLNTKDLGASGVDTIHGYGAIDFSMHELAKIDIAAEVVPETDEVAISINNREPNQKIVAYAITESDDPTSLPLAWSNTDGNVLIESTSKKLNLKNDTQYVIWAKTDAGATKSKTFLYTANKKEVINSENTQDTQDTQNPDTLDTISLPIIGTVSILIISGLLTFGFVSRKR